MAANSSSNDSLHPSNLPCLFTQPSSLIFIASSTTVLLLLVPLFVLVLYLGFQRWRRQRSACSSAATSHSDSFAYHMVSIELLGVLGFILSNSSIHVPTYSVGLFLLSVTWFGQTSFHILTCVERYLAVVHPVTYLSLRRERGIRIRNISIGGVWLVCFGEATMDVLGYLSLNFNFCILIFAMAVVSFCSLSVLCVLIRPRPGEQGGDRVDQSKRRAVCTIVAILGVLLLRCATGLAWVILYKLGKEDPCEFIPAETWTNVLTSLVLPLLYLHRAGRLPGCKNTN
uniref:uncharacterized protein LOC120822501 n=1 Tax=Gasterosteus aculeatus aculeatus TaxID=481459 RepID=UPI001A97DB6D|nr:uncharacterized protein LOC120822501 [Gasterosteus aculeatus aculeatus]